MLKNLLIISFVFIFSTFTSAQNKSVYSDLRPENCKAGDFDKSVPGLYYGKCKGVGGYDLEYYLDDERNSLGVVFPSKKVVGLNFWNYFSNFSELGTKAEWRMKKNKPVALIVRLNVSDRQDETKKTSYLIVTKISEENACVTDVIKPGKNQNVTARQLADNASNKECMAGFAESNPEIVSKLPADIAEWSGEGSDKIVNFFNERIKKLLDTKNYDSFRDNFESLNAIEKSGIFLIGSGCMIHACTHLESAVAVDLVNNTIHVAIFNEIEPTKFFNENGSKTPEPLMKWAARLESLKKSGSDNNTNADEPQAILLDEFSLTNQEDLMARFDNFSVELQNKPDAKGYIVINGSKDSRTKAEQQIKNYAKQRMFDSTRLVYIDKDGKDAKTVIEFWIVPPGTYVPER